MLKVDASRPNMATDDCLKVKPYLRYVVIKASQFHSCFQSGAGSIALYAPRDVATACDRHTINRYLPFATTSDCTLRARSVYMAGWLAAFTS